MADQSDTPIELPAKTQTSTGQPEEELLEKGDPIIPPDPQPDPREQKPA